MTAPRLSPFAATAIGVMLIASVAVVNGEYVRAEPVTIVLVVSAIVGVGLSVVSLVMARKSQSKGLGTKDDNSETQVARGGWIPLLIGRARVAPTVAAISDVKELSAEDPPLSGKRQSSQGNAQTPTTFGFNVLHFCCIGPADWFFGIFINGQQENRAKEGWSPLTSPTGTSFDLTLLSGEGFGNAEIQWGERDVTWTPPNLASVTGTVAEWNSVFAIWWDDLEVGNQKQIPLIEYLIGVRPHSSLKRSPAWIYNTFTDSNVAFTHNTEFFSSGVGTHTIIVDALGVQDTVIPTGGVVNIVGTLGTTLWGDADVYVLVLKGAILTGTVGTQHQIVVSADTIDAFDITINGKIPRTQIGGGPDLYVVPADGNEGANGAHVIDQVMFAPRPWGAGADRQYWDMNTFEEVGLQLQAEGLATNILAEGGQDADAVLGPVLQDLGIIFTFSADTGLWGIELLREVAYTRPRIPTAMLARPLPEVHTLHGARKFDSITYVFRDAARNFRDNTFQIDDDGQADFFPVKASRTVRIQTTAHFDTAVKIGKRREHEELSRIAPITLHAGRSARLLRSGLSVDTEAFPWPLRIVGVKRGVMDSDVTIEGLRDPLEPAAVTALDAPPMNEDTDQGAPLDPIDAAITDVAQEDAIVMVIEPSKYMLYEQDWIMRLVVLRVRQTTDSKSAQLHISTDNLTYTKVSGDLPHVPGGTLVNALTNKGTVREPDSTVKITPKGPDIADVLDLTADEAARSAGKLMMIVDGKEICFTNGVIAVGDGDYYVNGISRAKLGTDPQAHSAGVDVCFLTDRQLADRLFVDTALYPGTTVYVKSVPYNGSRLLPIASVTAKSLALVGKAHMPAEINALRTASHSSSFLVGGDAIIKWHWRDPYYGRRNGAGRHGAGTPVGLPLLNFRGEFLVEIWDGDPDAGGTLKLSVPNQFGQGYTIVNIVLVILFGGEPASFWVSVCGVGSGLKSARRTLKITRTPV